MTLELFITILVMSATATSVAVQIVKTILDKMEKTYDSVPIAVIIAMIVGVAEIFIYYGINTIPITMVILGMRWTKNIGGITMHCWLVNSC